MYLKFCVQKSFISEVLLESKSSHDFSSWTMFTLKHQMILKMNILFFEI